MRLRIVSDESMLPKSKIKRFTLGNRLFRYDTKSGKFFARSNSNGRETKTGCLWREIKFYEETSGYMRCKVYINGTERSFSLHRLVYFAHNQHWDIFDTSKDNMIDHENRDKTNNTIKNLRVLTNQQNQWNRSAKGYYFEKHANKWRAQIMLNGRKIYLGYFTEEEDAHNAYLKAKAKYHII
jgi:hypothetical protein